MSEDRCELLCLNVEKAERLRASAPSLPDTERMAALAKGLADPTRLRLAAALRQGGELCVCDLSWIVERGEGLVSHHLRLMRASGVARSRKDGKMVLYSLTGEGLEMLAALAAPAVAP